MGSLLRRFFAMAQR